MGCCTRFHRTWWPGYTSEVIDQDKVFDFQRRLKIIKRAITALLLLAIIAGSIYLVVALTTKSDSNCPPNGTEPVAAQAAIIAPNPLVNQSELSEALYQTKPESDRDHERLPQNTSVKVEAITIGTVLTDSSTEAALREIIMHEVHANDTKTDSKITVVNSTEPRSWCSSKKNVVECVGLSKNLKTVTTFPNNSTKKAPGNNTVQGYLLVKMDNGSLWHPYCSQEWTLDMRYKLCYGLRFKNLNRLSTVNLKDLRDRVRQLGKDIMLQSLAVVPDRKSPPTNSEIQQDLTCNVGDIICE